MHRQTTRSRSEGEPVGDERLLDQANVENVAIPHEDGDNIEAIGPIGAMIGRQPEFRNAFQLPPFCMIHILLGVGVEIMRPRLDLDKDDGLAIVRHEIEFTRGAFEIGRQDPPAPTLQKSAGGSLTQGPGFASKRPHHPAPEKKAAPTVIRPRRHIMR